MKKILIILCCLYSLCKVFSQASGTILEEVSDNAILLQKKAEQQDQTQKTIEHEEKKVALIMGNTGQKEKGMSKYVMDTLSMAALLAENNYSVKVTLEGTQKQLLDSLKEYSRSIKNADASFLYFAGEMTSFDGIDYLIPAGSKITGYDELTYKAVSLDDIFSTIAKSSCKKNLFVFDVEFLSMDEQISVVIPNSVSVQKYKMESYVVISAAEAGNNSLISGQYTPFTGALMSQLASSEASISDVIDEVAESISSITLLTDSTLNSGYYLKNTSAYVKENIKTEVVEKETTILANDMVEENLKRIAVNTNSDGQLFYVSDNQKEIILGNMKKYTPQSFVIGDSATELCIKYTDGEIERIALKEPESESNEDSSKPGNDKHSQKEAENEFNFTYFDRSIFLITGKSPFELYIDGVYYGPSELKVIKTGQNNKRKHSFTGEYSSADFSENHEINLVYKNKYFETKNTCFTKRGYTDYITEEKGKYRDGGNDVERFFFSLFNPVLGSGSLIQGDSAGFFLTFFTELAGAGALYLGYDLQRNWTNVAFENGISADGLDTTIPKILIGTGLAVVTTSMVYSLFRPYSFRKKVSKKHCFDPDKEKEITISASMNPDSSLNLCATIKY